MPIDGFEAERQEPVPEWRLLEIAEQIQEKCSCPIQDQCDLCTRGVGDILLAAGLLRQLAEQGEKLKAAEALASASLLGKSAAEHRVSALCTERDGLKARLGRMTEEQDNMLEGMAAYEHQVKALEQQRIAAPVAEGQVVDGEKVIDIMQALKSALDISRKPNRTPRKQRSTDAR